MAKLLLIPELVCRAEWMGKTNIFSSLVCWLAQFGPRIWRCLAWVGVCLIELMRLFSSWFLKLPSSSCTIVASLWKMWNERSQRVFKEKACGFNQLWEFTRLFVTTGVLSLNHFVIKILFTFQPVGSHFCNCGNFSCPLCVFFSAMYTPWYSPLF